MAALRASSGEVAAARGEVREQRELRLLGGGGGGAQTLGCLLITTGRRCRMPSVFLGFPPVSPGRPMLEAHVRWAQLDHAVDAGLAVGRSILINARSDQKRKHNSADFFLRRALPFPHRVPASSGALRRGEAAAPPPRLPPTAPPLSNC
jgi:hypothetical protein